MFHEVGPKCDSGSFGGKLSNNAKNNSMHCAGRKFLPWGRSFGQLPLRAFVLCIVGLHKQESHLMTRRRVQGPPISRGGARFLGAQTQTQTPRNCPPKSSLSPGKKGTTENPKGGDECDDDRACGQPGWPVLTRERGGQRGPPGQRAVAEGREGEWAMNTFAL